MQHVTRQKSRLFSVAHDLLSAEIEASNFDPLSIFVSCGKRYTVVSAQFDFFKSNLSVELEEVAFQSANVRDFIYSYFGDGESGIKSIGGISGGGGGSTGGGLTPEQLEILSWWKKDPDDPNTIFTEMNVYSTKELSAYGADSGGGSNVGVIQNVYGTSSLGNVFSDSVLTETFNAYTINSIHERVQVLEAGGGGGGGSAVEWGALANGYRQLTVEGVTYGLAESTHKHLWADIIDKPSTFAPSAHTHAYSSLTGIPSTFAPSAHTHAYSSLTGIPSTFAPSAHTHSASDISSGTFAIARIPTGTTSSTVALGNHLHTGVYEPVFSKNTAFNKNFGTVSGTVAQGNDSRINNGQTAYGWGNHASAGYALNSALSNYLPLTGGTLSGNLTLPNLTAGTSVKAPKISIGDNWSIELSGTELQIKRAGNITQRFLADGSIVGLGEVTAYGAGTGGDGVALLRTGGTMTGDLVLDANLGIANKALTLLGNSFKYNGSIVLTEANTANQIKMGNGWTIEQTSASLTIRKNGVIKGTFNA